MNTQAVLASDIAQTLRCLDFYSPLYRLQDLANLGREMLIRARTGAPGPSCIYEPSGLLLRRGRVSRQMNLLVIDVGGTHTKAAFARTGPGCSEEALLFDLPNEALNRGEEPDAFVRFAQEVATRVTGALAGNGFSPAEVEGIAIIWSNNFEARRFAGRDGAHGITALVRGKNDGRSYVKGEFFVAGLRNGDDIGAGLREQFKKRGVHAAVSIIANDSSVVALSHPHASGGVVASTGANVAVTNEAGEIFSTELGAKMLMPSECISPVDIMVDESGRAAAPTYETLIAGKWQPALFCNWVSALAAHHRDLNGVAQRLMDKRIVGQDISSLCSGHPSETMVEAARSPQVLNKLKILSSEMAKRAGGLAAVAVYLAAASRVANGQEATIAVDSSLARLWPGYKEALELALPKLEPRGLIHAVIERPTKHMTVAMRGGVNALQGELGA